jgi:hypothetical protein
LAHIADLRAKALTVAAGIKTQNPRVARIGGNDPVEYLEERALAGAIGTDEHDELTGRDGESYPVECPDPCAEGLHEPLGAHGRHGYR